MNAFYFQLVGIATATLVGALTTVTDIETMKDGRPTGFGWVALTIIIAGGASACLALIFSNQAEVDQRGADAEAAIERAEAVVHEVQRVLYALDDVQAVYSFTIPVDHPALYPYFERVAQGLTAATSEGGPSVDPPGISLRYNNHNAGLVYGFRPRSPWGPSEPGEEQAMAALHSSAVAVRFLSPAEGEEREVHTSPDIFLSGITSPPQRGIRGGQLLIFEPNNQELYVRSSPTQVEASALDAEGKVVSFLDLSGTEMHVTFESGAYSTDYSSNLVRDEINQGLSIKSFGLFGRGIGFSRSSDDFSVHFDTRGRPCFYTVLPDDPSEFLPGRDTE